MQASQSSRHEPPEVICIGETMSLVGPVGAERLAGAERFELGVGGAESTVALYLANLGHSAAWVSQVGADPLGDRMLKQIGAHGVDTSYVRSITGAPTGVYFKDPRGHKTDVYYYRRGSAASQMSRELLRSLPLDTCRVLHISGITAALSDSCRDLLDAIFEAREREDLIVSFDVNYRPPLWSPEAAAPSLLELSQRADVVLVGRDEGEALWGTSTPDEIAGLIGTDASIVVKDGDIGATEFTAQRTTFVPALRVDVVEPVGAGDAFAAGYLSALLRGKPAEARLQSGHRLASRALSSVHDFVPSA
ncbi:sugar kinase [Microbacterium gubbeenense]|uniref:sugar kinase n=1 Tax=Microbacterium gubbeenense TaxID=159896 RepID=UPI003F97A463